VPTVEADIQITPADAPGLSGLLISWRQPFPFRLNVTLDDGGAKSADRYRVFLTASVTAGISLSDSS